MILAVHRLRMRIGRQVSFAAAGLAGVVLVASTGAVAARSSREVTQSRPAGAPLMAIVALREQRVTIYDADGRILQAPVSTGQTGYETPAGIYSVIQKEAEHYSNLYDDASMPFMQRITWSGIALHAGQLPGHPASHGCIRMPYEFAQHLFDQTKRGMRVIVVPRDVAPSEMTHMGLFKPKTIEVAQAGSALVGAAMQLGSNAPSRPAAPRHIQALQAVADARAAEVAAAAKKAEEARQAAVAAGAEAARHVKALRIAEREKLLAENKLKDAERALEETETSSTANEKAQEVKAAAANRLTEAQTRLDTIKSEGQAKLDAAVAAREAANLAEAARVAAIVAAREANAKMAPVSVFISRETQQLYVRQAFQPVFETPVSISEPSKPIGTHVYTALGYVDEGKDMRWSAVTMSKSADSGEARSKGRRTRGEDGNATASATDVGMAKAALDRITIPQEAIDRISEVISPGSSLIVSDEPMSKETGAGTDFVVVMSGEPQGGIKIRQRSQNSFDYGRSYRRNERSPASGGAFSFW
jgi:L,D-transpeptidase-like protein